MLNESERRIIEDLTEILKRKQDKADAKPTVLGLLNLFKKNYGTDTKTNPKAEPLLPKKTTEKSTSVSAPATTTNEKNMKKYLNYFSLPQELQDIILSKIEINEFGRLADISETEKSLFMAMFARGWMTAR